ncbi:MAG: VTT domain-containing protein [Candidatus Tectomicrobia bacterium]
MMRSKMFPRLMLALGLGMGIVFVVLFVREWFTLAQIAHWVGRLGWWAPAIYLALWLVVPVLCLPGAPLGLAAGALFGPVRGSLYTLVGATAGATLALLVARYLAGDWAARRVSGRLGRLMQGVEAEGWRFVACVRLVPLLPFNLLNYALGLTRIPLQSYIIATFLGMLPGTVAYVYLGYAGREALAGSPGLVSKGLGALGLLVAVTLVPAMYKRWRRPAVLTPVQLHERFERGDDLWVLDVRNPDEISGPLGHISGARVIPVAELEAHWAELEPERDRPVAVVCKTDKRSRQAVQWLITRGFTQVYLVVGGMEAWRAADLPVQQ